MGRFETTCVVHSFGTSWSRLSVAIAVWLGCALGMTGHVMADGACCLENGACIQTTGLNCFVMGGVFSGDGSSCEHIDCTGACCMPDGSCEDTLTRIACEDRFGTFRGNGIGCEDIACELRGACCMGAGDCIPMTTYYECTSLHFGIWLGYGAECDSPDVANCQGACCLDDGTCMGRMAPDDCRAIGGSFRDFGTSCENPDACGLSDELAVNAVVHRQAFNFVMINFVDRTFRFPKFDERGGLRKLRSVSVEINGSIFLVVLIENRGDVPIILDDDVAISEALRVRFSENTAGLPVVNTGIWAPGLPIVDMPINCPGGILMPGQWCAFESPYLFPAGGGASEIFTINSAAARRGDDLSQFVVDQGDAQFKIILSGQSGFSSSLEGQGLIQRRPHRALGDIRVIYEYETPIGACCFLDGTCIGDMSEDDCMAEPTMYKWIGGWRCDDLDMLEQPCVPRGVCCLCDGTCVEGLTPTECTSIGAGQSANLYYPNMTCQQVLDAGLNCEPRGACCLPDATCVDWMTEEQCADLHEAASWNNCDACRIDFCIGTGACMVPGFDCSILTEDECDAIDGVFIGEGVDCDDVDPCLGDTNADLVVNLDDLLMVIQQWGSGSSEGDVNFDGIVDVADLLIVIADWGCQST